MKRFGESLVDLVAIAVWLVKEAFFSIKDIIVDVIKEFRK